MNRHVAGAATAAVAAAITAATALASAGHAGAPVAITLSPAQARPGDTVAVVIDNRTARSITYGVCPELARRSGRRWHPITRTHGQLVACPSLAEAQRPHSRARLALLLFDDLRPGRYRVTFSYSPAGHGSASVRAPLTVVAFTDAVLTGAIRLVGGPELRSPRRVAGTVVVSRAGGTVVARRHVGAGRDFRLLLAPGRYTLRVAGGMSGCRPVTVTLTRRAEAHADVDVGCAIR